MDELVKALRHFITRDLVFLVGGGIVVGSFVCAVNNFGLISTDHPTVFLLLAGISYAIGYAIQDGSGLIGLVRIPPSYRLRWIIKPFYKRIVGQDWNDVDEKTVNFGEAERKIITDSDEGVALERIITLKQVGTAIGPCCIVSSMLFLWSGSHGHNAHLLLAACGVCLGILLVFLSRVKGGQQAKVLERMVTERKPSTSEAQNDRLG